MSRTCQIDYIKSWDDQMKDYLKEFCDKVQKLGDAKNDRLKLPLVMSWWEMYVSWLPGVRKDRIEKYREALALDRDLVKTITDLRAMIIEKLDDFNKGLKEAADYAEREEELTEERAAIEAVRAAFREFSDMFKGYNWFFRLGSDREKRSFRQRYPDTYYIYITALSNS